MSKHSNRKHVGNSLAALSAVAQLGLVRPMTVGIRVMRFFLWASVLGWGIGLGGKLFDLIVVAGAWSASPPIDFNTVFNPMFTVWCYCTRNHLTRLDEKAESDAANSETVARRGKRRADC